jgi:bifunctional non-homologous end joining protein LigD
MKMTAYVKTTGSKGVHIYVPIVRGPDQHKVWDFARQVALELERAAPQLVTAEYAVKKRPKGRVLIDFNQNQWGRTLASIYSVRPVPKATVSAPLTWKELERGASIADFDLHNMPARLKKKGDLWSDMDQHRFDLGSRL